MNMDFSSRLVFLAVVATLMAGCACRPNDPNYYQYDPEDHSHEQYVENLRAGWNVAFHNFVEVNKFDLGTIDVTKGEHFGILLDYYPGSDNEWIQIHAPEECNLSMEDDGKGIGHGGHYHEIGLSNTHDEFIRFTFEANGEGEHDIHFVYTSVSERGKFIRKMTRENSKYKREDPPIENYQEHFGELSMRKITVRVSDPYSRKTDL